MLVAGLTLPDPDDRHVLAAAIRCGASVIVTFNQRDFPADVLASYGVESQHPDEFVENLFDLDAAAWQPRHSVSGHNSKPPIDVDRYLEILLRQGLVRDYTPQHGMRVFPIARSSHTMKNAIDDVGSIVIEIKFLQ